MSMPRWKAQISVSLVARNQTSILLTESVSLSSVFVRTDAPPPPMALLRLELRLPPDDERLVVHGMVANTVIPTSEHAAPGVEIVFYANSGAAGARWQRFTQYLAKTHPQSIERPVLLARDAIDPVERAAFVDDFRAVDVAPNGMFLATRQPFAVGTDVRVVLVDSETTEERALDCVVRRRATGAEPGIGLEYRNMTGEAWTRLVSFVSGSSRALRAKIQVVRAPHVPMMMQTLPGPW
jgi:hypothetical protein